MKKEDFESTNPGDLITVKLPFRAAYAALGLVDLDSKNANGNTLVRVEDVIAIEPPELPAAPPIKAGDKVVRRHDLDDDRVFTVVHVEGTTAWVSNPDGASFLDSFLDSVSCLAKVADDVQVRPKREIEVGCSVKIMGGASSNIYRVIAIDDGDGWVRDRKGGAKHTARLANMERVD